MIRQLQKNKLAVGIVGLMVAFSLLYCASLAKANPSFFATYAKTAVATSTLIFQTPGAATTTLVYDSYQCQIAGSSYCNITGSNEVGTQNFFTADQATLMVLLAASSTNSQENISLEYSDDGIDWYQSSLAVPVNYATSTLAMSLNQVPQYNWKFASSTVGGNTPAATNNSDTRAIPVETSVRYVRAVFACQPGGANCAVWAEFIPKKQQS